MAGRALRRKHLLAGLQAGAVAGVLDLDLRHRAQALGDALLFHAVAARRRLELAAHRIGQQDDDDHRHDERQTHRPGQLLGGLDRAFMAIVAGVLLAHARPRSRVSGP
jgi:hypothetical protein